MLSRQKTDIAELNESPVMKQKSNLCGVNTVHRSYSPQVTEFPRLRRSGKIKKAFMFTGEVP